MFFSKKVTPSQNAQAIIDYLGCKCEYFPPCYDESKLLAHYKRVCEQGLKEGFTPVIINPDETLAEWLTDISCDGMTPEEFRRDILSRSSEGGKEFFEKLARSRMEDNVCDEITEEELFADFCDGEPMTSFGGYRNYQDGSLTETILAYIPTSKPYEVFAWVPFGGWNECPDAEDMIKVARYWYEEYKVIPAVISHDTLEFRAMPLEKDTAIKIAKEQYELCPDIVDQGIGTIGALAHSLTQSTVWFFWWD